MTKLKSMLVALVVLCLHAAPLLAQVPQKPGPPPKSNPVVAWVITAVCIAAVAVAAFKSAKRTHQD